MEVRTAMFRKKLEEDDVRFCDHCSSVCDRRCESDAIARRALDHALRQGWRLA
jgi:hypothetical protein